MSSKSKRLGTLVDIFQSETLEGSIKKIKIDTIQPSNTQPRIDRTKAVDELAESLKQNGLLQPILITKRDGENNYRIIAGERRYHAAKSLGWVEIECKILNKTEKETYKLAIIENLQRENLTPYEEIEAIAFLKSNYHYTDQELAEIFGKSRSYMTEILSISTLNKDEMQICKENGINTKNLLVQAAQASKKGDFLEFIEQIKNKEIKTVKDAKKFNKKVINQKTNDISIDATENIPEPIQEKEIINDYTITKHSNQIVIYVNNPEIMNKIFEYISQELENFQP